MVNILTGTAFDARERMNHRDDEVALQFPSSVSSRSRNLLALRAQNWRAAKKGWTNPYVTDGLVAMWDGEWNGGGGIHHTDTTQKWVELCGTGCDLTYSPVAEIHDFYACNAADSKYGNLARNIEKQWFDFSSGQFTYEACINVETASGTTQLALDGGLSYGNGKIGLSATTSLRYMMFRHQDASVATRYVAGGANTFSAIVENGLVSQPAYVNSEGQTITGYASNIYGRGVSFGSPASDYWLTNGYIYTKFYNVRIYNRVLSAAEIAANYAVDKARFGLT